MSKTNTVHPKCWSTSRVGFGVAHSIFCGPRARAWRRRQVSESTALHCTRIDALLNLVQRFCVDCRGKVLRAFELLTRQVGSSGTGSESGSPSPGPLAATSGASSCHEKDASTTTPAAGRSASAAANNGSGAHAGSAGALAGRRSATADAAAAGSERESGLVSSTSLASSAESGALAHSNANGWTLETAREADAGALVAAGAGKGAAAATGAASSNLTAAIDKSDYNEKLYEGIQQCAQDSTHLHLQTDQQYIELLMRKAQPELLGTYAASHL